MARLASEGKMALRAAVACSKGRNRLTETFMVLNRGSVKLCSVTASLRRWDSNTHIRF